MSGGTSERPEWWRPGMTAQEIEWWQAAERAVADAPEIHPGDDVWMDLVPRVGGLLKRSTASRERAA